MPGQRILLVEDDAILRGVVRCNMLARGHEVRLAADTQSALTHLQAAPVYLVVLDTNLPDQAGWDVLRIAQQHGWLCPQVHKGGTGRVGDVAKLPVVVLSAVRVSLARLQEFRPLAYLPKPFPMDALLRLVAETPLEISFQA